MHCHPRQTTESRVSIPYFHVNLGKIAFLFFVFSLFDKNRILSFVCSSVLAAIDNSEDIRRVKENNEQVLRSISIKKYRKAKS